MAKLYIITKTYKVPAIQDKDQQQLFDIAGLFAGRKAANTFWAKVKDKPGYKFDEVETDLEFEFEVDSKSEDIPDMEYEVIK